MSKRKWHELEELTEIQEDICDFPYTVDYVKEHGISCDTCDREVVQTWQPCELMKNTDGKIYWRAGKHETGIHWHVAPDRVQTSMGEFVNENHGEFGGELVTPFGETVEGNFEGIIEWSGNVYAAESLNHFGPSHCRVVEFQPDGSNNCLFAYGLAAIVTKAMIMDEEPCLEMGAWYVTDEALFFLCGGYRQQNDGTLASESHLIKVTQNKAEETDVFDFCYGEISSIIVEDSTLYIGLNKELVVVDRESKAVKRYTFMTEEECTALREGNERMHKLLGW